MNPVTGKVRAALVTAFLFAVAIRIYAFPKVADDFTYFFDGWVRVVREAGVRAWNPEGYANYTPPNLYALWAAVRGEALFGFGLPNLAALKTATLAGDVLLGLSGFSLVRAAGGTRVRALAGALAIWLTPTLFLNAAWWGQFDGWYAAFLLFSIAALLRDRVPSSVFYFTLAVVWKAQALFVLPALGAFWLVSSIRRRDFDGLGRAIAAGFGAYVLAILPAMVFAGFPWNGVFGIYRGQTDVFHSLSMNAPNLWSLFPGAEYDRWTPIGIALGGLVSVVIAGRIVAGERRERGVPEKLAWILLSAVAIPFILPKMHERYFFVSEALAALVFIVRLDSVSLAIFLVLETVSLRTYSAYLFGWAEPPFRILAPMIGLAIVLAAYRARGSRNPLREREPG